MVEESNDLVLTEALDSGQEKERLVEAQVRAGTDSQLPITGLHAYPGLSALRQRHDGASAPDVVFDRHITAFGGAKISPRYVADAAQGDSDSIKAHGKFLGGDALTLEQTHADENHSDKQTQHAKQRADDDAERPESDIADNGTDDNQHHSSAGCCERDSDGNASLPSPTRQRFGRSTGQRHAALEFQALQNAAQPGHRIHTHRI